MEPLVSIVCIAYNHGLYIRECLESFISQKVNFPIEVLVNDDCSKDNTAVIIREYEQKYPNIFRCVYQKENQYSKGVHPWFDILFPMARGKYIALCEGDDYWIDPYKLQKQVDFMETHEACSVCAHNSLVYNTENNFGRVFVSERLEKVNYTLAEFVLKTWFTATQSLLYRADALPQLNPPQPFMQGDYYLQLRLLLKEGSYLHYDNQVMGVYRDGGWASSNYNQVKLRDSFIALLQFIKEQSNHRCDEVFDAAIEREKNNKQKLYVHADNVRKANSWLVKCAHFVCRTIVFVVNKYVPCLYISKRV